MRIVGLAALAAFCVGIGSAHACDVPFIRWTNKVNNGVMQVASGKECKIYFTSAGPTPQVQIVKRPANGKLVVGSVSTIVYQSRPGFVGRDSFSYTRTGLNHLNRPIRVTMQIAVTVTP